MQSSGGMQSWPMRISPTRAPPLERACLVSHKKPCLISASPERLYRKDTVAWQLAVPYQLLKGEQHDRRHPPGAPHDRHSGHRDTAPGPPLHPAQEQTPLSFSPPSDLRGMGAWNLGALDTAEQLNASIAEGRARSRQSKPHRHRKHRSLSVPFNLALTGLRARKGGSDVL
jgi:hypothetical protein